jgi:hypothetical protein
MDYISHEPDSPVPAARPCSTPHSAPVGWLRADAGGLAPRAELSEQPPPATEEQLHALAAVARRDPNALADAIAAATPGNVRSDGWTGFSHRLFLQVLADTGRVSMACEYAGRTRQSAYALRARDRLFAAGGDAAALMARNLLADDLYEKAIDGVTDTVVRDGKVIAERRRFDWRLSTSVLARLDKRCDSAAETGSPHLAVAARWDEWLKLMSSGDDAAALALLEAGSGEPAKHCPACQLAESEIPTAEAPRELEGIDLSHRCWIDGFERK